MSFIFGCSFECTLSGLLVAAMVKICTSPSNSRTGKSAIILPKLTKIGNEAKDTPSASSRNLLIHLIEECLEDESHIIPLYDLLLQRQRSKPVFAGESQFSTLSTIYAKADEDFLSSWIVSASDFTLADLMAARSKWSAQTARGAQCSKQWRPSVLRARRR